MHKLCILDFLVKSDKIYLDERIFSAMMEVCTL